MTGVGPVIHYGIWPALSLPPSPVLSHQHSDSFHISAIPICGYSGSPLTGHPHIWVLWLTSPLRHSHPHLWVLWQFSYQPSPHLGILAHSPTAIPIYGYSGSSLLHSSLFVTFAHFVSLSAIPTLGILAVVTVPVGCVAWQGGLWCCMASCPCSATLTHHSPLRTYLLPL